MSYTKSSSKHRVKGSALVERQRKAIDEAVLHHLACVELHDVSTLCVSDGVRDWVLCRRSWDSSSAFLVRKGKRRANEQTLHGRWLPFHKLSFIKEKAAFLPQPNEAWKTSWKSISSFPTGCFGQAQYLLHWGNCQGRFYLLETLLAPGYTDKPWLRSLSRPPSPFPGLLLQKQ